LMILPFFLLNLNNFSVFLNINMSLWMNQDFLNALLISCKKGDSITLSSLYGTLDSSRIAQPV